MHDLNGRKVDASISNHPIGRSQMNTLLLNALALRVPQSVPPLLVVVASDCILCLLISVSYFKNCQDLHPKIRTAFDGLIMFRILRLCLKDMG